MELVTIHEIFKENNDEKKTILNSNNLTNQSSNISKCEYNMILDDASKINQIILDNNNSKNVEEEYDMLNDTKSEINKKDEWVIIDNQSNVKKYFIDYIL